MTRPEDLHALLAADLRRARLAAWCLAALAGCFAVLVLIAAVSLGALT